MKVCLIGIGKFGTVHKRTLEDIGVPFITVDINGEAERISYADYDFDHAIITTPIDTHYKIAKDLLLHNIHVFVEKPLAMTSAQCEELLKLAKERNLKLQCGYIERFNPIVWYLKDKLDRKLIVFERFGSLYDTAVHDIDLALWFYEDFPVNIQGADGVIYMEFREGDVIIYYDNDPSERTINGINIRHDLNILKDELEYFLYSDNILCYNALDVMKVIDSIK